MRYLTILLIVLVCSCDEEQDRFEQIGKLRAIGVEVTPIAATAGPTGTFTSLNLYVAQPSDTAIEVSPYMDSEESMFVETIISEDAIEKTTLNDLYLYKIKASVPIPPSDALTIPPEPGFVRLTYGITATSGDETEDVIGRVLVYEPTDEKTKWDQPQVNLVNPVDGATLGPGEIDLKATIDSDYAEQWRVSWFVTGGKIQNRRAKETKWETPDSGDHTVILTVRGLNSNTFVLKTAKISIR